jgi:hypothetical protein
MQHANSVPQNPCKAPKGEALGFLEGSKVGEAKIGVMFESFVQPLALLGSMLPASSRGVSLHFLSLLPAAGPGFLPGNQRGLDLGTAKSSGKGQVEVWH